MGNLLGDLWQVDPIKRIGRVRKSSTDANSAAFQNLLWFQTPEHEQLQPTPRKNIERKATKKEQLSEAEQSEIEKNFGNQFIM